MAGGRGGEKGKCASKSKPCLCWVNKRTGRRSRRVKIRGLARLGVGRGASVSALTPARAEAAEDSKTKQENEKTRDEKRAAYFCETGAVETRSVCW